MGRSMKCISRATKISAVAAFGGLLLAGCGGDGGLTGTGGDNSGSVVKLGISAPMSGDAAGWGIASEWLAKQAAEEINADGGVPTDDGNVTFEVVAEDNEYTAAGGTQAAQTLLTRENVDFISFSVGTAPVQALQSMTEQREMVMLTSAWGKDLKGPEFPYTFTVINTPFEVLEPLATHVLEEHPDAQTITLVGMNDATGTQTEEVARDVWQSKDIKVLSSNFYEHGTTEWAPIATKLLRKEPDIMDLTTVAPGAAGLLLRALADQGWDGVTILSAGTGGAALVETAGQAAEGVYMGLAADYSGSTATEKQRELEAALMEKTGENLNGVTIGSYDAVKALAAAIEEAGTIDSQAVRDALPNITFESSYGPSAFGAEDQYGSPQQILTPVIITQVLDGEVVEVDRVIPAELEERL